MKEHLEEGIRDFGDCLRCHRVDIGGRNYGAAKAHEGFGGEDEEGDGDGKEYKKHND